MALLTRKNTIGSRRVYEGKIVSLRLDTLSHPHGHQTEREIVEHNGGVVIACQPQPDQVILIKQYRYSVDEELLELPAGRLESQEEPLLAAQRELIEETGYRAEKWEDLGQMFSAPGFCNELLYLYRATRLSFVGKDLDDDEETEVVVVSLTKAWELAITGKIRDAKTIAGLALLKG